MSSIPHKPNFILNKIVTIKPGQRCYFVGDIHGRYDELMGILAKLRFNFDKDMLISVGDLMDRGPDSLKCLDLVNEQWFESVYANHEEIALKMALGSLDPINTYLWLTENGGEWYFALPDEQVAVVNRKIIDTVMKMPITLEVHLPNGKRIGVLHAEMPINNWQLMLSCLSSHPYKAIKTMVWKKDIAESVRSFHEGYVSSHLGAIVHGIDAVVMGHVTCKETMHYGNCAWMDTGAKSGLSVLSAESILSRVKDVRLEGCYESFGAP